MGLGGTVAQGGLPLEQAERGQLALAVDDGEHRVGAEAADELVLEVDVADVHVDRRVSRVRSTARATYASSAASHSTRSRWSAPSGPYRSRNPRTLVAPTHREDGHVEGGEVEIAGPRERLHRDAVALALDQDGRRAGHPVGVRTGGPATGG